MKSTQIIWIDDKTSEIENVVNEIFESLWEQDIRSNVYIFPEESRHKEKMENDIRKLNELIVQAFVNYLISKDWIDDDKGDEAYQLINLNNNANADQFIPESDVAKNKFDIFNALNLEISKNEKIDLSSVLNIENEFEKDKIIMIDMCLSQDDFFSLSKRCDKKILSMYLYEFFKNKGYPTYMYTTFVYPNDLIKWWREIYKNNFDDKIVKFFNRSGEDADNITNNMKLLNYILEDVKTNNDKKNT